LAAFVAPARAKAELWRIGAALALMILAFIILTQMAQALLATVSTALFGPMWTEAIGYLIFATRSPVAVIAVLAGFLPLALGLALALRALHDRSWTTLLGPGRLTWQSLVWVGGTLLALQLVILPVQVAAPEVGRHLTLGQQIPWLVPAVVLIVLQSATEEALFRGYLVQQLAVRSAAPLIWMGVPALLFAALHLDPRAGAADMLWTGSAALLFAVVATDLTARTGSLGPAIGLHAASNIGGLLLLGLYGKMDGLALWNLVLDPMRPWSALPFMAVDLAAIVVSWLLARLILRV
jgi:membrane protease YdiL (CAAX protease family)